MLASRSLAHSTGVTNWFRYFGRSESFLGSVLFTPGGATKLLGPGGLYVTTLSRDRAAAPTTNPNRGGAEPGPATSNLSPRPLAPLEALRCRLRVLGRLRDHLPHRGRRKARLGDGHARS